jgi:hypothetical protein
MRVGRPFSSVRQLHLSSSLPATENLLNLKPKDSLPDSAFLVVHLIPRGGHVAQFAGRQLV